MSTDYKNLFNKNNKKDYSNLFSDQQSNKLQDSKMAYKNLFGSTEPQQKEVSTEQSTKSKYGNMFQNTKVKTSSIPVFPSEPKKSYVPERKVDPRFAEIAAIDPNVPGNTVIRWLDNFDTLLAELGTKNQQLADEEVELTNEFINERFGIQDTFTGIKNILSTVKAPAKKKGFMNFFSGSDKFVVTREMVDKAIKDIRTLVDSHAKKQRYGSKIFLKSKLDQIQTKIMDIKLNAECAYVACNYLISKGDYKAQARLERIALINQINQISEAALQSSYNYLSADFDKFEKLKEHTVRLLYIKLQNLLNDSLDPEVHNLINQFDEL